MQIDAHLNSAYPFLLGKRHTAHEEFVVALVSVRRQRQLTVESELP